MFTFTFTYEYVYMTKAVDAQQLTAERSKNSHDPNTPYLSSSILRIQRCERYSITAAMQSKLTMVDMVTSGRLENSGMMFVVVVVVAVVGVV
jgi:hypothetical protein